MHLELTGLAFRRENDLTDQICLLLSVISVHIVIFTACAAASSDGDIVVSPDSLWKVNCGGLNYIELCAEYISDPLVNNIYLAGSFGKAIYILQPDAIHDLLWSMVVNRLNIPP